MIVGAFLIFNVETPSGFPLWGFPFEQIQYSMWYRITNIWEFIPTDPPSPGGRPALGDIRRLEGDVVRAAIFNSDIGHAAGIIIGDVEEFPNLGNTCYINAAVWGIQTWFGHLSDMLWTCVGHVLAIFWKYSGHVLAMFWKCFGYV